MLPFLLSTALKCELRDDYNNWTATFGLEVRMPTFAYGNAFYFKVAVSQD